MVAALGFGVFDLVLSRERAGLLKRAALVNVIWGLTNFAIAGVLGHIFFPSELPPPWSLCIAAALGALAMALWLANHFAKVRKAAPHP